MFFPRLRIISLLLHLLWKESVKGRERTELVCKCIHAVL